MDNGTRTLRTHSLFTLICLYFPSPFSDSLPRSFFFFHTLLFLHSWRPLLKKRFSAAAAAWIPLILIWWEPKCVQRWYLVVDTIETLRFFLSRVLRDSTPRFVGQSVRPSHITFSAYMGSLAMLLQPKCSIDLKYGPCPPARDWGSRVSGLVWYTKERRSNEEVWKIIENISIT